MRRCRYCATPIRSKATSYLVGFFAGVVCGVVGAFWWWVA
jgi:hypothetical protein